MRCINFILSYKLLANVFFIVCYTAHAQVPQIEVPRPAILTPNVITGFPGKSSVSRSAYFDLHSEQAKNNEDVIKEVEVNEKSRMALEKTQIKDYSIKHISLPDFQNLPGTDCFRTARKELTDMLQSKRKMSIKRAIFLTENAYFGNKMNYQKFNSEIQNLKNTCLLKMKDEGLNPNDDMAKKMMIFRVMTDVINVKEPGTEKSIIHYPMKYDFEDYAGNKELSQLFVSKLLTKNSGQCHSMPLLFLILSEELNTDAHLAFSPQHSFIKFQDKEGRWYNAELTRGALISDDSYMSSGFIKAEALKNKLYLDPLSKEQVIAHLLAELGRNYIRRYGYDGFVKECLNTSLKYYSNDIYAYTINADYNTARAMYVIERCGMPSKKDLPRYPQAYELYKKMHQSYAILDSLGYEDMPADVYQNWLQQVKKEKVKPENQPFPIKQIKK